MCVCARCRPASCAVVVAATERCVLGWADTEEIYEEVAADGTVTLVKKDEEAAEEVPVKKQKTPPKSQVCPVKTT